MNLSLSEYKAIVEFSPNMIWRSGTDAKCNYFNETWLKFTGKTMKEELGIGWTKGVHPDDFDACMKTYLESFDKHEAFEMEYRLARFDGQPRWINDRGVPFYDENGLFSGYIGSCIDVTDNIEGRKLTEMAHVDTLTGLYNRNYLEHRLEYEFDRSQKEQKDLVILMMDIDKFKFFNDHYGHGAGDMVLKQVAQKISEAVRKKDVAGRYGGDEFLVILPDTDLEASKVIAQRILQSVPSFTEKDISVDVSLSIGIADRSSEANINEVIEKADRAMYFAKQNGGGAWRAFQNGYRY
jgi:diguanylate cyclase (GGDEF)-like protein/PAS domain S-box-containing protein